MINIVIIGAGHYATGTTVLSAVRRTDKDTGVFLPSVLALKAAGIVKDVALVATKGDKVSQIKAEWEKRAPQLGWNADFNCYPGPGVVDPGAYKKVLETMPKPCAALIAVPDHLHLEIMEACIEKGIHFLVVKPAVTRLEELERVLAALENRPLFAMVDYHKVFDEANILLKEEYQGGEYGRLQHAASLMTQRRDMLEIYSRWFKTNFPPNINHYLGSHYIHMVGFITAAEPVNVRATAQYGIAANITGKSDIADLIETQIRWREPGGGLFASYHVSGWSDPPETEAMTYQELQLICEKGHVESDQRYRGFKKVIAGEGSTVSNPHFFNLHKNPRGFVGLETKYGFLSVRTFVESCLDYEKGKVTLEELNKTLPSLKESKAVTAILEAADRSLDSDSKVVTIEKRGDNYILLDC